MENWREERNETIVNKVARILQNAEHDRHITIVIEAHPDEIPSIRYNITEDIVPDMRGEEEKGRKEA